jgi:hypothetical protein
MQIRAWLNTQKKDYRAGVELYEKYASPASLLVLFKSRESTFNKNKLITELTKICEAFEASQSSKKATKKPTEKAPIESKYTRVTDNIPEALVPIHELKTNSFKQLSVLHNKLCEITLDELNKFSKKRNYAAERFAIQEEMLLLDEVNEQCWYRIYYYNEHGHLPIENENEFVLEDKTIRELVNLEKAIPTYISKINTAAKKEGVSDEKCQDLINKKVEWQLQADLIKKVLDELPVLSKIKEALC